MITRQQVDNVIQQQNLVVRNLQITQSYYRLSQGMRKLIGSKNASWWAFGCHASKTAGRALRHETLPGVLKSALIRGAGFENTFMYFSGLDAILEHDLTAEDTNKIASALTQISLLVSAGNLLIFKELAWLFAEFVSAFWKDYDHDVDKLNVFLNERLTPGPVEDEGQDFLFEALTAFYDARFATDTKRKAELILRANLLVGLHEQTRLQPYIQQSLAVPFDTFVSPGGADGKLNVSQRLRQKAVEFSREMVTQTATQMLMSYSLPNKELKLGQNVSAPTGMLASFPADLMLIQDPRLREIISWFDTGIDTLSGSAALNWGSLQDRMSFIVDFFRAYQQYTPLFQPPFAEDQVPAIEAGQIPTGPL